MYKINTKILENTTGLKIKRAHYFRILYELNECIKFKNNILMFCLGLSSFKIKFCSESENCMNQKFLHCLN